MNVELLEKVKQEILNEPRQFDMNHFFFTDTDSIPNCGTSCCIAGWAIAIENKMNPIEARIYNMGMTEPKAREALRISFCDGQILFFVHRWPQPFKSLFENTIDDKERAQIACDRIDHFIKTRK